MSTQLSAPSTSPLLPLDIRLSTLEHLTYGSRAPDASNAGGPSRTPAVPVTVRLQEIEDTLEQLSHASESLKRLLSGYAQYRPFLTLNESHESENLENELVSDVTRTTLLFEAAGDIVKVERELRQVEVFAANGVEGSGRLEELLPLRGTLDDRARAARNRAAELEVARKDVRALLQRYNDFTSTVSDLFLDLHQRLETMEEMVAIEERGRRKQLKERF